MNVNIGDQNSYGTAIYASEEDNMTGDWIECIFLKKRQDLKLSIRAYKLVSTRRALNPQRWVAVDRVIGISTSQGLISALRKMEASMYVAIDMQVVIEVLQLIDPKMASDLKFSLS